MSNRNFVHLHCHSHYSLLDGASPIDKLIARAKERGMNALALTDHGNLHGALEFYQKAKAAEINPILGYEAYVAPQSRRTKEMVENHEASYHLTLLAQNRTGFKNLTKLASSAYLEGFYRKPRIDKEILAAHSEGIVCLSGCVSGEFSKAILRGADPLDGVEAAKEIAAWFHGVFGDRYFVEIQDNGLSIQQQAMAGAVEVANQMGLPLVATSDAHYVDREDAEAQDILLCINTGKFRTDTNRMRMTGDEFFLRSPEDMYEAFPGHEDAVARSQQIADTVDIDLELGKWHFPNFTPPDEKQPEEYLRELCIEGLKEQYADKPERLVDGQLSDEVIARLDRELGVISTLGYPNYFLIVWDFVRVARARNIPCTARGSGVGSLVAYALGMSHVCPLEFDLLFERFLDVNRKEPPDIDIDFCRDRRGEVIDYVKQKYGEENVAQIGTFGTLAARAAIRDTGRALGMPLARVDSIVAKVPDKLGIKLADAIVESDDLKKEYDADADVRELLDLAMKIEGLARNIGTHAAAVVISDKPLVEYVPLCTVTGKEEVLTQWAMNEVERAGLLKMDFLGLRNLTILAKAVDLIEISTGERIDPDKFPIDDEGAFGIFCRGETKGIFQFESGGIRDLLQRMKPDQFRDIIATNALYRPGPLEGGMVDEYIKVKHGQKEAEYKHPVMKEVLEETNGVMVYQEQVMRILNGLGGIELSSAYTCIKAISKKKLPIIAKFEEQFLTGSTEKGLSRSDAVDMFEMIKKFAGYGFNKSHSTAYAMVAYMTAYLKAHYPAEFMAALLCGDIPGRNFKKKDSLVEHLEDCKRMNIEVLPPDVNCCGADFTVSDGKINFGLSAIKGCGGPAATAIAEARKSGAFTSLFDFCERIDPTAVGKTAIESLVKAGAFDSVCDQRARMMAAIERALQAGAAAAADRRSGQKGLFDDFDDEPDETPAVNLPDVPPWDDRQCSANEKEVLGYYLTSHPLAEHLEALGTYCSHTTVTGGALSGGSDVVVGGIISSIKFSNTKNARNGHSRYAMFDLEDVDGMLRTIIWPDDFVTYGHHVEADKVVVIRGKIDKRPGSDEANLICNELLSIEEAPSRFTQGVRVRIQENSCDEQRLKQLHEIVRGYPGNCNFELVVQLADGRRVQCKSDSFKVGVSAELRHRVDELLGPGNFKVLAAPPPVSNGNGNGRRGRNYG